MMKASHTLKVRVFKYVGPKRGSLFWSGFMEFLERGPTDCLFRLVVARLVVVVCNLTMSATKR